MGNPFSHLNTAVPKDGWLILGPGGGGCVHSLTVNPHRPDTLVVSCDMTAGYITHNGGKSWREFNLNSRQFAYAFDPLDANTLYVGTSGLFRSTDNGASWQLIFPDPQCVSGETRLGDECYHAFVSTDNWPGRSIHAILIDPLNPAYIFIVIKKDGPLLPVDALYERKKEGLFIYGSADRGQTWWKRAEINSEEVSLLAFDPSTPVGARDLLLFTNKDFLRIPPVGTPTPIALPPNISVLRHASCGVVPVPARGKDNQAKDRTIFYIVGVAKRETGQYECSVWKTDDCGRTWKQSLAGLDACIPDPSMDGQPVFSQVSACTCDARRVYLVAEKFPEITVSGLRVERYGILKSSDEGESWEWVVRMDDDHDPSNREFGWAESDYGTRWGDLKGEYQISPKGRFAWDVVASPVDPDICYTMDFSTVYVTRNGGATWQQLVTNIHSDGSVSSRGIDVLSAYAVFFDPFEAQHLALAITDVGIFHSHNGGHTWQHALKGVPREWINTCYWMVFDPEVQDRAWSAWSAMHDLPRLKMMREEFFARDRGGICRTEDGLQTWHPSASGLPEHAICTHIILDLASPPGQRTLYVTAFHLGVYKSVDDGRTWEVINNGLDPRNLCVWRMAQFLDGTLYLVVVKNRMKNCEHPGALYRSNDQGVSWTEVPLPEGVDFPNDLTVAPSGRLYLACWPRLAGDTNAGGGAYASDDGGQNWVQVFDPEIHVYSVTIDPKNPASLYLGTFDAALFHSSDSGRTWQRLKGYDFQWGHRPVIDPHNAGKIYMTTFGSSVWYGPMDWGTDT